MPTMTEMQKPKTAGFVDRGSNYLRKQKRMEEEEAEIKRLEEEALGKNPQEAEEPVVEVEEEVQETPKKQPKEEKLSAEEKSFKKRYGDLRRHMQEKEKEWEERFKALEAQKEKEGFLPPKSDEDIAEWAQKYPDVASIVETIAKKKAQEMFASADSRLKELDKVAEETRISKAEALIRDTHPDFDELRDSDNFHNWAEDQPSWVQKALYENMDDPKSVIRVIDLYKVDNNMTAAARRDQTKNAAKSVGTRNRTSLDAAQTKGTFSESQVARMSMEEYEAQEQNILEAQRNGKFVYDLSGGAR